MKNTSVSERVVSLENVVVPSAGAGYTLNVTVVYHDEKAQAWAREVYGKVASLAGKESVRAAWWRIDELGQPGVLAGAVSTAMRADLIIVAIDGGQALPLPFNVWVNTWLPNRLQQAGCLVGLIGAPGKGDSRATKASDYLRAVAQAGGFEFLVEQRVFPGTTLALPRPVLAWKRVVNGTLPKLNDRKAKLGRETPANLAAFAPAVLSY